MSPTRPGSVIPATNRGASRAGYAVGLVHGDGTTEVRDPKLIRIGEMLPSEEIDMSADAALLEATYAQRALDGARAPSALPAEDSRPDTATSASGGPVMKNAAGEGAEAKSAESSHSRPVDAVGRVELKATVGKAGFFDLSRALSWLRDNAADVHVDVSIDAIARDEGFDRVKLRNGVVEPLEEGGTNVEVTLE